MSLRIVGGKHRGRRIATPADASVRPTSERAREALFNILAHGEFAPGGRSLLAGARALDAFCGAGAFGFEALSRGAVHATFLDDDPRSLAVLRATAAALGERARVAAIEVDALKPGRAAAAADVAFLDPPYGKGLAAPALAALAEGGWFAPGCVVVVETDYRDALAPPAGFAAVQERRYGRAKLTFLRYRLASPE